MLSALPVQAQMSAKKSGAQKTKVMKSYLDKKATEAKLRAKTKVLSKAEIATKAKAEAKAKAAQSVQTPLEAKGEQRTSAPTCSVA